MVKLMRFSFGLCMGDGAILLLDNERTVRRLKRLKPYELV
jgi:hypothetical protein